MKNIAHFFKYNNFVPVAAAILILGGGGAFAATPQGQEALLTQQTSVVSVDNSYIIDVDLDTFAFAVRVTEVTEDDVNYYVAYEIDTIDLVDGVWEPTTREGSVRVQIAFLAGKDLGLYVEGELAQLLESEKAKLAKVQEIEARVGETTLAVATEYSGLVGQFLEDEMNEFPDYDPVLDSPELINPFPASQTMISNEAEPEVDVTVVDQYEEQDEEQNEPPAEEPPVEEPPVEEPPAEEPPLEEPPVETPPTEEPRVEEPPVEEPPTEEPPGDPGV